MSNTEAGHMLAVYTEMDMERKRKRQEKVARVTKRGLLVDYVTGNRVWLTKITLQVFQTQGITSSSRVHSQPSCNYWLYFLSICYPLLEMSFFCLLLKLVLSYPVQILQISSGFYELGKQSQMIKMYFKYIFNKDPACYYLKKKREKAEYKRKKRSLKIQFRTKYVTTINEHYC